MDLKITAIKFASYVHKYKLPGHIDEIVLYGSLAKGATDPNDIDILLLHHNPILEEIQRLRGNDNCKNDYERYGLVSRKLKEKGYPSIDGLLEIPECNEAIGKGLLNVIYLHLLFFRDLEYRKMAINSNNDPNFFSNIFNSGLLWNDEKKEFDTPIANKYQLPNQINL